MNHWQTIKLALEFMKDSMMYLPHSLSKEEVESITADIDAALAFVREQAQAGAWLPVEEMVEIEVDAETSFVFGTNGADVFGATEDNPKGYRLCRWHDAGQQGSES